MEWLEELEDRVRQATDRLRELREENDGLRERIAGLEAAAAAGPAEPAEDTGWDRERDEIRTRVERLTRHLEELLSA